ncbi:type IV pilin protein [Alcanivorax sp. S6407]|nr:type IV pilin protein [Alcanivorax sp. S6407]
MDLAAAQERWRAQNFEYTASLADLRTPLASNKNYSVSLTLANNNQTYVAEVTPNSGTPVAGEASFKIDQDGTTCYGKGGCTLGSGPSWSKK